MTNGLSSWRSLATIRVVIPSFALLMVWGLFLPASGLSSKVDFHVAPMQCYTNLPFRRLCSSLSPSSTYWTEMEKADDLLPNVRESLMQRLGDPSSYHQEQSHHKLVLQLGSNDPKKVQECVQAALALQCDSLKEINLNCGCPAIDSGGAPTYGASLMKDPTLTASLVEACVESCQQHQRQEEINVSVKCRIGVVEHADDLESQSSNFACDYQRLHEYVSKIQEAGANHVILHARPAVLAGLSPVKNRIVPRLQYDMVHQVAADFPNLQVTLNGGIRSLVQLTKQQKESSSSDGSGISSFMAGRWILQRPLDLIGIEEWLQQQQQEKQQIKTKAELATSPSTPDERNRPNAFAIAKDALEEYFDYCIQQSATTQTTKTATSDLCLPLFLVVEQLREDYDEDDDEDCLAGGNHGNGKTVTPTLSYVEMESLYDLLHDGVAELGDCMGKGNNKKNKKQQSSSVNFKRLSTSFKSLVGTKVANKWKRNRAELL